MVASRAPLPRVLPRWNAGWRHPALAPSVVLLGAAAVLAFVAVIDPNEPGNYPTGPFLYLTGYYCPGCGTLRALHALTHGRPVEAFALNPLTLTMLPVLAFLWVRWLAVRVCHLPRPRPVPAFVIWGFLAAVLAFWLVRNLPFGQVLAP